MQKHLLLSLLLFSGSAVSEVPTTQVPFTYVIDYTGLQATNPEFREKLSEGTPTLYHPGPEMRYLGRYGFGSPVMDFRNMPYQTYERQIKDYLQFMRQKGIRWVTPYLCNQTISGNVDYRYGVWEVHDRWEDFSYLQLGHKPSDPINWMQREPSGNLHYNYKRKCFLERHNDDLQIRYAPCPNNQEWRNLCNAEARAAARIGFDGLFIDNNIIHCYCPSCEKRFQDYLKKKYPPDELHKAFGTKDYSKITLYKEGDLRYWARTFPEFIPWLESKYSPEERRIFFDTTGPLDKVHVDAAGGGMLFGETAAFITEHVLPENIAPTFKNVRLANPALQTPVGRLRWAETMMFWGYSIGEQLAEMRNVGREVNPDFFLVPNWGVFQRVVAAVGRAEDGKDMRRYSKGATWQMYEEDSATGIIAPGVVLDYDLQLRYAFACGVQAMLLPYTLSDADIEDVHHAEAAASGGSVFVTTFRNPEVRAKYRDFFEKHADLYEDYRSAAKVALVFLFDQCHYLNIEHFRQVHALNRFLADQQIPFDHIIETDFTPQRLADYKVIILPNIEFMSDEQIDAVQNFIDQGGTVITIGEIATYNLYCKPWQENMLKTGQTNRKSVVEFESLELALPYRGLYLESGLQAVRSCPMADSVNSEKDFKYQLLTELDKTLRFKRYQDAGPLTEVISNALGNSPHLMDPQKASGVRHSVWVKSDGGKKRMIVHLVNKNVPLAAYKGKRVLRPVENLVLNLPCESAEKIQSICLLQPGEKAQQVKVPEIINGHADLTVPKLEAYLVVDVLFK